MGAGRTGWYSYDRIENGGQPSARTIVPRLQALEVGTIFPALPGRTDGFILIGRDPERSLTLASVDSRGDYTHLDLRPRPHRRARDPALGPIPLSQVPFPGLPHWLVRLGHFLMQRRQLLGPAQRAEQSLALAA